MFFLSQLMRKITNIRTKYKLIFLCITFSKFFLAIPVPRKFNPGCQHVLSRNLEPSNSLFSLVSYNSPIRTFNSNWVILSIGLSYWCGSKYIFSVCVCKELLSDSSLKLSCEIGTGRSGPWGTGRIADKRFGYIFFCFVFRIVTGNVYHTKIAVIVMILLLAPLHGHCKRHCLLFSVIPVTQSLDTSVASSVRCERFVWSPTFNWK
jgi:hypothetical protein